VVEAVAAGRFHVAAVAHADDAIELLTGLSIGEADAKGEIAEGTINHLVASRLIELFSFKQTVIEETKKKHPRTTAKKKPVLIEPGSAKE
jgi:hypothetical protein